MIARAGRIAHPALRARAARSGAGRARRLSPLKHALRFGATCSRSLTRPRELARLAAQLAPDVARAMLELAREVDPAIFAQLAPLAPPTGVIGLAERPWSTPRRCWRPARGARRPARGPARSRQHGRLRAGRRGRRRGRRAQHRQPRPVASRRAAWRRRPALRAPRRARWSLVRCWRLDRPLLALDPDGEPLDPAELPARAVLAFGTERHGLSERAARPRRRARQHPDARRRLEPQPRHLRGRRAVRLADTCRGRDVSQ